MVLWLLHLLDGKTFHLIYFLLREFCHIRWSQWEFIIKMISWHLVHPSSCQFKTKATSHLSFFLPFEFFLCKFLCSIKKIASLIFFWIILCDNFHDHLWTAQNNCRLIFFTSWICAMFVRASQIYLACPLLRTAGKTFASLIASISFLRNASTPSPLVVAVNSKSLPVKFLFLRPSVALPP